MRIHLPLRPVLLPISVLLTLSACDGSAPSEAAEVASTVQQLRAGNGQAGEVFLGIDVLATHKGHAALGCSEGSLDMQVGYSLDGAEGPFTALPASAIEVTCGDLAGDFALVVDNSGSEEGSLPALKHSARDIIHRLLDLGGRASLVRVSTEATVLNELTDDRPALEQSVNDLFISNGWTALYDGIRTGNETLGRAAQAQADTRYADAASFCGSSAKLGIVAITDGHENNSSDQHASDTYPGDGLDTVLEDLKQLRVGGITTPIYTVGVGERVDHEALSSLATHTGGRHMAIERAADIARAFDVIGDYAQARHQVCTELPRDVCGDVHVRVAHTFTGGGQRPITDSGEHVYRMNIPCPDGPAPAPTPGRVATVLMALSDADMPESQAGRLASQTLGWVSPVATPRVLLVLDDNHHGEHPGNAQFVTGLLRAAGHQVDFRHEPADGLSMTDIAGYDVVWFNNPGYPADDAASIDNLRAFALAGGGVVLEGDDMAWSYAEAFSMTPMTGLRFGDNGTEYCGKQTNDGRGAYAVRLADEDHPILAGIGGLMFDYADDIDTSSLAADESATVLAWATAKNKRKCADKPVITVKHLQQPAP